MKLLEKLYYLDCHRNLTNIFLTLLLGAFGTRIPVSANYFEVQGTPQWTLYQYRVDFSPEEDNTGTKKRLLRTAVSSILAGYLFDGTVLYTPNRISVDPLELFVEHNEQKVRLTLRMVGEVTRADAQRLQVFNVLLRKCLACLNLQLVGRNYYDAAAKVRKL